MANMRKLLLAVSYFIVQAAAAHILARQATTPTTSPLVTGTIIPASTTTPPAGSSSIDPNHTTLTPQPSQTDGSGSSGNGSGGNGATGNSPLLFFVALGFGVVFTNLWIIVGVKYCFRYNTRNRQMRLGEDGEPIGLQDVHRPHRRRREKKLMTMDEVNEKFPMTKYKNWVAERAKEGLPTTGGVSAPPSRANSVRSVEGVVPEIPSKERESEERPTTSATAAKSPAEPTPETGETGESTAQAKKAIATAAPGTRPGTSAGNQTSQTETESEIQDRATSEGDEEDDDHIDAALPVECVGTSGDTCAICIDTLEDDDDVRGLTCGHAFHAACIDPWLTNRRASCPLCKADYYTPKPRPPPADGETTTSPNAATFAEMGRTNSRMNMPASPAAAWQSFRGPGRMAFLGRVGVVRVPTDAELTAARASRDGRTSMTRSRTAATAASASQPAASAAPEANNGRVGNMVSNFRQAFPALRLNQLMRRQRNEAEQVDVPMASGANPVNPTPSQLEAGTAPALRAS